MRKDRREIKAIPDHKAFKVRREIPVLRELPEVTGKAPTPRLRRADIPERRNNSTETSRRCRGLKRPVHPYKGVM